ncbi:MAG: carbohydrate kinase [Actinomycetota bacterium]|nr:carbohydrate kinase [Actinomycetota bacterium]
MCGEAVLDLISDGSPRGYQARAGGSPLNVAVGTARLGLPTSLLARLGSGIGGRLLRSQAADSGVDLSLSVSAQQPVMLALVSLDSTGDADYDFYVDGTAESGWQHDELPDPLPETVEALHVGSIAAWRAPSADLIAELVLREHRRGAALISFDPNLRPALVEDPVGTRARIEALVALVHLVKVSVDDLDWLYPGEQPDAAAQRWARAGPTLVVLTEGVHGVRAYRSDRLVRTDPPDPPESADRLDRPDRPDRPGLSVPAHEVSVVDTVGAGDAFTAGLLAALAEHGQLSPNGLAERSDAELACVLASAGMVAALCCTRPGADPPSRAERDAALARRTDEPLA